MFDDIPEKQLPISQNGCELPVEFHLTLQAIRLWLNVSSLMLIIINAQQLPSLLWKVLYVFSFNLYKSPVEWSNCYCYSPLRINEVEDNPVPEMAVI
jgi:hypothetical protein